MNDKINNELIKIQDELSTLDSAVQHINTAGLTATEVVNSIKELQGKYNNHLNFIQNKVNELLTQSKENADNTLAEIAVKYTNQAEEIRKVFLDYHKENLKSNQQSNELLEVTARKNDTQIKDLTQKHKQQIDEVSKLLNGYLDLAQSTAKLNDEIQKVNFPSRLMSLENAAKQLNQVQIQLKTDIQNVDHTQEEILNKIKKQNRKSSINLIFNILIFLMVAGIGIEVLFHFFPQLMEMFK